LSTAKLTGSFLRLDLCAQISGWPNTPFPWQSEGTSDSGYSSPQQPAVLQRHMMECSS